MSIPQPISAGAQFRAQRTVSSADIDTCARLTGDSGTHHVQGIEGRQVAQGLLTVAAVPLLGSPGSRVRDMSLTFLAPVFAGDTVQAVVEVTELDEADPAGPLARCALSVSNEQVQVLRGTATVQLSQHYAAGSSAVPR